MARRHGTTTERGLGADHQADKKRLLAALRDGEPCWRCGQPMYRTQKLDRDHVIDRVLGGAQGPAVLSHASCNRAAGGRLGHQIYPFPLAAFTAPPATCKTCGKTYKRRAQSCEICGAHYHPSYGMPGEQRTCSRTCGVELRRRTRGTAGKARKPTPSCVICGKPCNQLSNRYCSKTCSGQARSDARQTWPSSRIHVYTCRYCGKTCVTKASGVPREVCPDRPCQLARLQANNLRARNGLSKEEADVRMATIVASVPSDERWRGRTSRRW
jgi:hypothetical protein